MILEQLLANLVRSPAMQEAVHRIGAYTRLQEVMSRNPADPAFDGLLTPRALVSSQPLSPIRSRPILESVPWDPLKKEEPPPPPNVTPSGVVLTGAGKV